MKSPTPRRRAERGFTLLELLVSLALFSIGVVSLFVVKTNSVKEAYMTRNLTLARLLGESLMEDLMLGTRDYEDGASGDVYTLEGLEFESFQTPEYEGFYWEIEVREEIVVGNSDEDDEYAEDESFFDEEFYDDGTGKTAPSRRTGKSTSRRSEPSAQKDKKGGGGGLFGGGGGGDDEDGPEGEPVAVQRLIVRILFPVGAEEETFELETLVPFIMDDQFEGIEGPTQTDQTGAGQQGEGGQQGNDRQQGQGQGGNRNRDANRTFEEIFGGDG